MVNCRFLKPYDREVFQEMVRSHPIVVTLEEGQVTNGFGAFMARELGELNLESPPSFSSLGIPDAFIEHGSRGELLVELGLDVEGIARHVRARTGRGVRVESA